MTPTPTLPIKKRVAVLMGGQSTEHDVSLNSGAMIVENLDRTQYEVFRVKISREGLWSFDGGVAVATYLGLQQLVEHKIDIVVLALHGQFGEDGVIQGALRLAGIRFTGSDVVGSAVAMDKALSMDILEADGLKVGEFVEAGREEAKDAGLWARLRADLSVPFVVKPNDGGSSVGASIVTEEKDFGPAVDAALQGSVSKRVIFQEYLQGKELTCAVLEEDGRPQALPVTEIVPKTQKFFDYEAKYTKGASDEITPARISPQLTKKVQAAAVQAHTLLRCRGYSRADIIAVGEDLYVLEVNTLPGMTKTSLLPQAAAATGMDFSQLLDRIISEGLR